MANKRPDRKNVRRAEAAARNTAYAELSAQTRWDLLDMNLGIDKGAPKERAKLYLQLIEEELTEELAR